MGNNNNCNWRMEMQQVGTGTGAWLHDLLECIFGYGKLIAKLMTIHL